MDIGGYPEKNQQTLVMAMYRGQTLLAGLRLPRDHSVRFPDSAALVAGSF
jgi:hypothetical protein